MSIAGPEIEGEPTRMIAVTAKQAFALAQGYRIAENEGIAPEAAGMDKLTDALDVWAKQGNGLPAPREPRNRLADRVFTDLEVNHLPPTTSFAEWLADANAKPVTIPDGGAMLDWLGQAYDADKIDDILAAVIEFHGELGVAQELHATKNEDVDGPWQVLDVHGRTSHSNPAYIHIGFKTTQMYLDKHAPRHDQ